MKRLSLILTALMLLAALSGCACGKADANPSEPTFTPEPTDTPEPVYSEMKDPYVTPVITPGPNADPDTPTAPFEIKRMGVAVDLPTAWLSVVTYQVYSQTRMEIYHTASLDAGEGGLICSILADNAHTRAVCDEEDGSYFLGERGGLYYYLSTPVYVRQYDDSTSGEYKKLKKQLGTLIATFRFIEMELPVTPVPSDTLPPGFTPTLEPDGYDG